MFKTIQTPKSCDFKTNCHMSLKYFTVLTLSLAQGWKRNKTFSLFAPEIPTQEIPYHVWTGVTVEGDDSSAVLPSMRTELIG